MKKTILPITVLLLTLAFVVTACGGQNSAGSTAQSGQGTTGASQGQGQGFGNRPISPQLQLAVGIFKLEGTPQAVNAQEAAQLIPLWQLYSQLETSSSSAPQEVTATFNQIKSALTSGQINAITAMNLTNQEAFTFMQQQGIVQVGGFGGTPQANRTPRAGGGGGGGFPGGGGAGGPGGSGPGGTSLNPSQIATAQARRAQGGGFSNRLPSGLLNALIKLLQSKAPGGLTSTPAVTPTTAGLTETPLVTPAITPTP